MLDLITEKEPPPNRKLRCDRAMERHLTEAAVMLRCTSRRRRQAFPSSRFIRTASTVSVLRSDHGWRRGFKLVTPSGATSYGGRYERNGLTVVVSSIPGLGDVEATVAGKKVVAECKGGIVNTRHAGQLSRLRRGLCEAVGLLMTRPRGERQFAVVPHTPTTLALARKMLPRARDAGIEIALVKEDGSVIDVSPTTE
jgi:hypothetical protein